MRRRTGSTFEDVAPEATNRDLVVLHTSTPSFRLRRARRSRRSRRANPSLKIGMIGAKVAVEPEASLKASRAIDFVARNEFDFTIKEVAEGRDLGRIAGLSWRRGDGTIVHNEDRAILENMDELPFVTPVYKRDLVDRELFQRLSQAPLHFVLHRPRLQIALHVLPVAADHRRPSLPHPQRRACDRGADVGAKGISAGQGILLRRRYAAPTTCRASRRSRARSASSGSSGRATPRPTSRVRP